MTPMPTERDDGHRLVHIERQQERTIALLEALTEKVDSRIAASDVWRMRVERSMFGADGSSHGLLIRLDRAEQQLAAQKHRFDLFMRIVVAPVLLLMLKAGWDLVIR